MSPRNPTIADPVEAHVAKALARRGLAYVRDIPHPVNGRVLDFYISKLDLFIEVKQFHSDWIEGQVKGITNVLVVQGMPAALAFDKLINHNLSVADAP